MKTADATITENTKTDDPQLIPIRATLISAIFVVPYVIIFRVFMSEQRYVSMSK
jgi:hypothetical protein